jgi:hypothetical protein
VISNLVYRWCKSKNRRGEVRQRRLHDPDLHRESNLLDFLAAMPGNRASVSLRMRRRGLSLLYIKNTRRVTEAHRSSRTESPIDRHGIIYLLKCYLPHSKPVLEDEYNSHHVKMQYVSY